MPRRRRSPPEKQPALFDLSTPLPFGILDLEQQITTDPGPPLRVKCYVRDCKQMLRPPAKGFPGDVCPEHGIRGHCSGTTVTYTYAQATSNLIIDPEVFQKKVRGNPHKLETHRFGYCNSEDALTWNVLRSFQAAGALHLIAEHVTGRAWKEEPKLLLWGLTSHDDQFRPWPLLTEAHRRFEIGRLPVARPLSEPDAALVVPKKLVLILEAKLLAENPVAYRDGPRKSAQSLTLEEVTELYHDAGQQLLDYERLRTAPHSYTQLQRYLAIADFIARLDSPTTEAYLANVVRAGREHDAARVMRGFLRPGYENRFARLTWEQIYTLAQLRGHRLCRLSEYMLTKAVGVTGGFAPAFWLDAW
jgi:hypothetical protein